MAIDRSINLCRYSSSCCPDRFEDVGYSPSNFGQRKFRLDRIVQDINPIDKQIKKGVTQGNRKRIESVRTGSGLLGWNGEKINRARIHLPLFVRGKKSSLAVLLKCNLNRLTDRRLHSLLTHLGQPVAVFGQVARQARGNLKNAFQVD